MTKSKTRDMCDITRAELDSPFSTTSIHLFDSPNEMPMRHPLRDLPLDSFLPLENRTSAKRPLSPSTALLSPSKRRILSAEGLYSPEKRRDSTPSRRLFSEFVASPHSPARKLDFAALSHPTPHKPDVKPPRDASSRPQTPIQRSDTPKLAPSPEIPSGSVSGTSSTLRSCDSTSDSPCTTNPPLPMLIPREMPTFSDRQSIHWPGFDVHADTHIAIPTSQTTAHIPDVPDTYDEDDTKENVRPRRRGGKRLLSDEGKAGKSVRLCRTENHANQSGDVSIMSMLTASLEERAFNPREKEQERRHNKLIMVRELDREFDEEEDVEQQL